jgi:hypothetical protein
VNYLNSRPRAYRWTMATLEEEGLVECQCCGRLVWVTVTGQRFPSSFICRPETPEQILRHALAESVQ